MVISARTRQVIADTFCVAVLACLTVLFCARSVRLSAPPFEDAAMLLRYAENIAAGHGIVWNPGEAPVDGATDFLPMMLVAALRWVGVPSKVGIQVLGLIAHLATVLLVYLAVRRTQRGPMLIACAAALYLAFGPGVRYIGASLATPVFAAAAAGAWFIALRIMQAEGKPSSRQVNGFVLLSLSCGFVRPEGVFLSFFMLVAIVIGSGVRANRRLVRNYLACYAVIGGLYLLWRWSYFGHLLPNPFYRKGGGHLYWRALRESVQTVFSMGAPFFLPLVAGLLRRRRQRAALAVLFPIFAFTSVWILLSDEMNFVGRFQYACLPLLLMSWYPFARGMRAACFAPRSLRSARSIAAVGGCALLVGGGLWAQVLRYAPFVMHDDGRYDVACRLRRYAERDYVIATTEAGLLPLFSQWRAVDAWGLNDAWIAHHGTVTAEYLDRYRPAVVMWHAVGSPSSATPADGNPWNRMVRVLENYVRERGYVPVAAYGPTLDDRHLYWVDPQCPDAEAIRRDLGGIRYTWYATGRECVDLLVTDRGGT